MKLSEIPVNSILVDNATTYNGAPIEWIIAAHNVDGDGITTVMINKPFTGKVYDAKEPQNPNTYIQKYGNGDYEKSNLLQWLNSDKGEGEWYKAQHEYDQAPNSDEVGGTYANEAGFLHGFSSAMKSALQTMEKMGIERKIHLPGEYEIEPVSGNIGYVSDSVNQDTGVKYTNFNHSYYSYIGYTTGGLDSGNYMYIRGTANSGGEAFSYVSTMQPYSDNKWYSYEKRVSGNTYIAYIIPVIYLASTLPVIYENGKYFVNYALSVKYNNYGKHKAGFSFDINLISSETDGPTDIKIYVDDESTLLKTVPIAIYNEYTPITLQDNDVVNLSQGQHTIKVAAEKDGLQIATDFSYEKVSESVPIIVANEIGNVADAFFITYQVYDEDGDDLDVTIKLDETVLDSKSNVEQNVNLIFTMPASRFNAIDYGNHVLSIMASDGINTNSQNIPFVKCSIPSVSMGSLPIEVEEPFSVEVSVDNADGSEFEVKAYIDGLEIKQ